jgi:heme-degrading monooxygenase HmoA
MRRAEHRVSLSARVLEMGAAKRLHGMFGGGVRAGAGDADHDDRAAGDGRGRHSCADDSSRIHANQCAMWCQCDWCDSTVRPCSVCVSVVCQAPIMVLEIADIRTRPGTGDDFVAAYRTVRDVVAGTPGCGAIRMTRCFESPDRFVLLVEWETVEAHEQNFRATDRFTTWRAAIGPYFERPPYVEHFADV